MRGEGKKYIEGIEEPKLLTDALRRFDNVAGVSEVLHGAGDHPQLVQERRGPGLRHQSRRPAPGVRSRQPDRAGQPRRFPRPSPPARCWAGRWRTACSSLSGDSFILEARGESRRYRVSAIYETGVSDIDRVRVYLNMGEARSLLKQPTGASFLQINLYDKDRAPAGRRCRSRPRSATARPAGRSARRPGWRCSGRCACPRPSPCRSSP